MKKLRICSFSEQWNIIPLWAYYADNFKGICLEVEVDKDSYECEHFFPIDYNSVKISCSSESALVRRHVPMIVLGRKHKSWEHEREHRILTSEEHIKYDITITGIIFGRRTPAVIKHAIENLASPRVKLWTTDFKANTKNKYVLKKEKWPRT